MLHDGALFSPPPEDQVPDSGVGPARVYRCETHKVEFTLIWLRSMQAWLGDCPRCKPISHQPAEQERPEAVEPIYELLSTVKGGA